MMIFLQIYNVQLQAVLITNSALFISDFVCSTRA